MLVVAIAAMASTPADARPKKHVHHLRSVQHVRPVQAPAPAAAPRYAPYNQTDAVCPYGPDLCTYFGPFSIPGSHR